MARTWVGLLATGSYSWPKPVRKSGPQTYNHEELIFLTTSVILEESIYLQMHVQFWQHHDFNQVRPQAKNPSMPCTDFYPAEGGHHKWGLLYAIK